MKKRTVDNDCLVIMDENGGKLFSMKESFEDDIIYLALEGNINLRVAHDFEDELTAAASVCSRIVVDLSGVDSISSAGLKALLLVQRILDKRQNSLLKLKGLNDPVYEMFQDLGFVELLEIER